MIYALWKVPCLFTIRSLATVATGFSSRLVWCPRAFVSNEYLNLLRYPYVRSERSISQVVLLWRSRWCAWCFHPFIACLSIVWLGKSISLVAVECRSVSIAAICSLFCSILVAVRLRKSISPVVVEWRSVYLRLVLHCFSGLLVVVRLGESVFRVSVRVNILFLEVKF